jgi:hypothetical protein
MACRDHELIDTAERSDEPIGQVDAGRLGSREIGSTDEVLNIHEVEDAAVAE